MKTYKSSDLTHKRAEVLKEAKTNGAIIQERNTNGEVRQEYIIADYSKLAPIALEGIEEPLYCLNTELMKG